MQQRDSHDELDPLDPKDPQVVCIRPVVALADRVSWQTSGQLVGTGPAHKAGLCVSDAETTKFRLRLLERVQAAPEYAELNKTEKRYLDLLISDLATEGGEIEVKHDEIAGLVGQSRRNVIRVMQSLVDSGLLTVGRRYRQSSRGLTDRTGGLQNTLRCANVYRVARRFMTALKFARKLIRRKSVTAVKPDLQASMQVKTQSLTRETLKALLLPKARNSPHNPVSYAKFRARSKRAEELAPIFEARRRLAYHGTERW